VSTVDLFSNKGRQHHVMCYYVLTETAHTTKDYQMATYKTTKTTITLTSTTGSYEDRLLVASWARNLVEKCEAEVTDKEQRYTLSAGHLQGVFTPSSITLEICNYFMEDIKFWAKHCKK
jgi:hypothetical protein